MTLAQRRKQTIEVFGETFPAFQDCFQCKRKLACEFSGFVYNQPCVKCRSTQAYEEEILQSEQERSTHKHIGDALQAQKPVAMHTFKGRYLYTNSRGDIIKDEKARPMKTGEKFKK